MNPYTLRLPPAPKNGHQLLLGLMICASLLHIVQLILYPVNPKWYVALVGSTVYTLASIGITKRWRWGYYLATGFPIFAGLFVLAVLAFGPPVSGQGINGQGINGQGIKFNPFTALAAAVELPGVVIGFLLIGEGKREGSRAGTIHPQTGDVPHVRGTPSRRGPESQSPYNTQEPQIDSGHNASHKRSHP